jgi:hypothetical protein
MSVAAYPAFSIAALNAETGTSGTARMAAVSVARLTVALATPGTFFNAFSTRATQEAQVMPMTCSLISNESDRATVLMPASECHANVSIIKLPTLARSSTA